MATTMRLNDREQEAIRKKAIEINKVLIGQGRQPLRDVQIVHEILEKTIPYVRAGVSGELQIDIN